VILFVYYRTITSTTPIAKYGPKPTLSTPYAIDSSTESGNDYIPSDKKKSYTTEPIPTSNGTQLLAEPPTRYIIDL